MMPVPSSPDLPRSKGSYLLLLELANPVSLIVGRLGALNFPPGFYAYAGNARGSGGLAARLRRHLKTDKASHWHIDYLRRQARVVAIWAAEEPAHTGITECALAARLLAQLPFRQPYCGFGSSDCTCRSHLMAWVPRATEQAPHRLGAVQQIDTVLAPLVRLLI